MAKNVYHNGRLIPAKDWDYEKKLPKLKQVDAVKEAQQVIEETELVSENTESLEN